MAYKLTGVTRNNSGAVLGSCECFLFKYNSGTGVFTQTGSVVTSDPTTGAFAFTGIADNASAYQVVFYKNGSPNVFDVTDRNLTPVIETVAASYPDVVTGLVGGGASYSSWWGLRAYSTAAATGLAPAINLTSINAANSADIHLTSAGILNTTEIAALDATTGLAVSIIYDQVGSAHWVATGATNIRPLFRKDHYGTNKHALEFLTGNIVFVNSTTFLNTATNYILTAYAKRVTGQDNSTGNVVYCTNTTAFIAAVITATDIQLYQDPGFAFSTATGISANDVPASVLWQFGGTVTNGTAINRNGVDNVFTGVGNNTITDNQMGLGIAAGGGNNWIKGFWSEGGYMINTKVTANTINATKRSAITNEMKAAYT